MKKIHLVALTVICLALASCGQKSTPSDNTPITPDTEIKNKEQSARVCAPFIIIKYFLVNSFFDIWCFLKRTLEVFDKWRTDSS